jgi:hypothetical protein
MSDPKSEDPAWAKARRGRNIALAIGLVGFVIVVFIATIARLGGNVATHGF